MDNVFCDERFEITGDWQHHRHVSERPTYQQPCTKPMRRTSPRPCSVIISPLWTTLEKGELFHRKRGRISISIVIARFLT